MKYPYKQQSMSVNQFSRLLRHEIKHKCCGSGIPEANKPPCPQYTEILNRIQIENK